jgi:hypothetical protein
MLRVFENGMLKRIFGPKSDGATGEWKKINNEELSDLYSSPNIILAIKSRTGQAGHVASMGRGEVRIEFWWENLRERDHIEGPGIDGRIILRLIFRKWDGGHGLDLSRSG